MTEAEYIIATNRAKVSIALHALRDVLAGSDWGVDKDEITKVLQSLYSIEQHLFSLLKLEG
ncbi:MAG TPA: hypothetical protein VFM46_09745 [Pseudomonadales bacterium]|nr:hypothetical protein [Pseudomonadales bacterium]